MDLETIKLDLLQKILQVSKISLLEQISRLLDQEMIVGYTEDGTPLNKEAYEARLLAAEKEVSYGKGISQEDLEKESEDW